MAIKMPAEVLHFEWNWASVEMFNEPAVKIDDELLRLQSFGINRPTLASLGLTMSTSTSTWVSNVKIAIAVVVSIVVILGIAFCLNCCYRHRHKPEVVTKSSEREAPIIRHTPANRNIEHTDDTESVTDIYAYNHTSTPIVHRRRPHVSHTMPIHRNSAVMAGMRSSTLPHNVIRAQVHEDPPSYKSIEDPDLRRTRSGNIQSMRLPRPPDLQQEEVSRKNSSWTTT